MTALHSSPEGLATLLERNASLFPAKTAIIHPNGREADGRTRYRELAYSELQGQIEGLAAGLARIGITKGTRTVLMAAPGPDLFALSFALFRLGAIPVLVDPGMGVRRMLQCYRALGAEAFIGPPIAHVARVLSRRTFARIRIRVTLGSRWFWGGHTLKKLRRATPAGDSGPVGGDEPMMIGFTTGSTGPAKGVEFTHRMGVAMARELQSAHDRDRDDVSLITLPLFGMFDLVFGSTLVLAPVAPSRVADAEPGPLVEALVRFGVTTMFASPALLRTLGEHLTRRPAELPALRCVVAGGAPVPADVVATLRAVLDEQAKIHVTYGATEVLPISSLESAEILEETAAHSALGLGTCVGRPLAGLDVRTIAVTDDPLPDFEAARILAPGEVGEIVVAGDSVSPGYHRDPASDALHKIRERPGEGQPERVWHRTGDLGHLDESGRLWFCGRKSQRVRTAGEDLYTVCCEGVFNAHPCVRRSALVGVGQRAVVCVETEPGVDEYHWRAIRGQLRALAGSNRTTRGLRDFLRHPGFPVDIRHNAKINREELARWAARRLARGCEPPGWGARALRAIPLAGWAYLLYGIVRPNDSVPLEALWWIDAFLSIVVHAAQIPKALPRGRAAGCSTTMTVWLTLLYGATWWKRLPVDRTGVTS
ncbi:fatty acid CoA ligase family protein [Streptomyces sp. NPDC094468]|uniref:fatty acid CoA ligase family protein n=1 Tax=Streptomyces sp. NPDC094468 TaxID=3366066 RepID=UPI00382D0683